MPNRYVGAKLTETSHADIIAWLEENEISPQPLIIHMLRVCMTIGITSAPINSVEVDTPGPVIPDDEDGSDFLADIMKDLEAFE